MNQETKIEDKPKIKYVLCNQDVDTSFLTLEMTWSGINTNEVKKHVGMKPLNSFLEIIEGKTINYYVESHRLKKFVSASAKSIVDNKDLLDYLESETIKTTREIRDLAIKNIDRVDNLTNQELILLLKQTKKLQAKATTLGTAVAFADIFGDITNNLISILKNRKNLKYSLTTYTHVLGSPVEKSLTEEAYDDIRSKNNENELLKKYFWLDQGYIGRGLNLDYIKTIKKEEKNEETYPAAEELRNELKLSEDEQELFNVSASLIRIKSLRADSRQFLHVLTNKIVDLIADKLRIESRYFEALYAEEICNILENGSLPKDLEERWMHSIVIPSDSGYKFFMTGKAENFLKDRLVKEDIKDKESVKGQIAQPGKVSGKVKLVFGPQHNNKIEDNEILISRATSPQLLPAMKKAGAFITDVGGITSHAAIVAREMKNPALSELNMQQKYSKTGT
jgi:phosphoenolpyruvate synthase/pyruvate phosphate dikinase